MEFRDEERGTYRVLPDRAQPCVWMVAGVLSYRLCDRDYDCERCPLDAAIHGGPAASAHEEPTVAGPGGVESGIGGGLIQAAAAEPAWGIRDGLRYHPVYGWVAESDPGRLRWGIDALTARLLDHLTEVILPAAGTHIAQGKVACWAIDDGELVPLRSPVSGRVVRGNQLVARDPAVVTHAPYDEGWLVEVEAGEGVEAGLFGPEERRAEAARQMKRFHRAAMGYLHTNDVVGPTAHDGGERLQDLRRVLGRARYHRLVFSLLR